METTQDLTKTQKKIGIFAGYLNIFIHVVVPVFVVCCIVGILKKIDSYRDILSSPLTPLMLSACAVWLGMWAFLGKALSFHTFIRIEETKVGLKEKILYLLVVDKLLVRLCIILFATGQVGLYVFMVVSKIRGV